MRPHRLERYMASTDPDFESKAALCLQPPQHAAIFCVDEKTAIQASYRLDPLLPLSPDGPSVMASSTTGTARSRCMPHSIVISLLRLLQRSRAVLRRIVGHLPRPLNDYRTSLDLIVALFLRVEYAAQASSQYLHNSTRAPYIR